LDQTVVEVGHKILLTHRFDLNKSSSSVQHTFMQAIFIVMQGTTEPW